MKKKKILLITTKNCIACKVQQKNVKAAILQSKKDIDLEVRDFIEVSPRFLTDIHVTDFPATLYYTGSTLKLVHQGSTTVNNILTNINKELK